MRKHQRRPKANRSASAPALVLFAAGGLLPNALGGCSFRSLDYLQAGSSGRHAGGSAGVENGSGAGLGGVGSAGLSGESAGQAVAGGGNVMNGDAGSFAAAGAARSAEAGEGGMSGTGGAAMGGNATAGRAGTAGAGTAGGGKGGGSGAGGSGAGGSGTGGSGTGGSGTGGSGTSGSGNGPTMVYGQPGQSCKGGLTCPLATDCCHSIAVMGGAFLMGTSSDPNALPDEKPPHTANLVTFSLDEFEVTVGRFRRFFDAYDGTLPMTGMGAAPGVALSGWQLDYASQMPASRVALQTQLNCDVGKFQTWTAAAGARESMPINCVSWYVAFAFCIWDGGRLPSEAEWERVASGGEARLYPWGSMAPDPATNTVANCLADHTSGCQPSDLLPVGSRPSGAGKWGHQDLAGSLWEWVLDYYDATYYQSLDTCDGCVNTAGQTPRVIRGGNFTSGLVNLRSTGRASKVPRTIDPYAGFRCAQSL